MKSCLLLALGIATVAAVGVCNASDPDAPSVRVALVQNPLEAPAKKQGEVFSVEEFQAIKPRWSNWAALGVTVTVEGRLISRFDRFLRLYKCDVLFVPPRETKLPALPKKTTNVVVSGRLVKVGKKFQVVVKSLDERPTDEETFAAMKLKLPFKQSASWYRAGAWAVGRGKFYGDVKLDALGRGAYERAVEIERSDLPRGDDQAVFQLAAKAKRLRLPDGAVQNLLHLAYRTRWSGAEAKGRDFNDSEFLTGLKKDLPGADVPLKSIPRPLADKYRKSPQRTYETADAAGRKALHRLLYLEAAWRQISGTLDENGSNGFDVATEIERRLPEYRDRAEPLREKELAYRLRTVGDATRAEAVALADLFRQRKAPKKAAEALRQWVKAREPKWRKEGPTGLLLLAEATQKLLNDDKTATDVLLEAARKDPNSPDIATRLGKLGYEQRNGIWVQAAAARPAPPNPLVQAIRKGTIVSGMTPMQVRRAMAGTPRTIHRAATSRTINEVWLFQRADGSRLAVHFRRFRDQPRSTARVFSVSNVPVR
jgi:hypothetical protein